LWQENQSVLFHVNEYLLILKGVPVNNPTVPITSLPITQKHTTVVVEPTAFVDGFEASSYDTAEMTTMLWVNNPTEQWVEIPVPYSSENFSASIAVISAGPDEYQDRVTHVKQIKGDLNRFVPYLQRMGFTPEQLDTKKELKEVLKGFRVAVVLLPARSLVVKITLSAMLKPVASDTGHKTFNFKAYAPLLSFVPAPGRVSLKMLVIFKNVDTVPKTIQNPVVTNPFGEGVGDISQAPEVHDIHGDRVYAWRWTIDPVVEFSYNY
jgi:hypothetical protein